MTAQTIVITGASDGIGAASARQLRANGANVVVVGRSPSKTEAVARELSVPHHVADFSDLGQVRALAEALGNDYERIDVLANNAGGIMGERALTVDGFEKTFQVNHLAQFLLTNLLIEKLVASAAKVVQTASSASRYLSRFDIDDLQNERNYSPNTAYGNGKLANILFTRELHNRFGDSGLSAVSFHPGVVGTNFSHDSSSLLRFVYREPFKRLMTISPEKGGKRLTWLAEGAPGTTWMPGEYYVDTKIGVSSPMAYDENLASLLWEKSSDMVGL